jgi:hypothetical protein
MHRLILLSLLSTVVFVACGGVTAIADAGTSGRSARILVIYNHGSSQDEPGDCQSRSSAPKWIRKLEERRVGAKRVKVVYPCTDGVSEDYDPDGGWGELRVCKRAKMISELVEEYVDDGYLREHIFLAGQSAGAWASLLVKRHDPGKLNGVIVTAPAFGGKRSARFCHNKSCRPGEPAWAMRHDMRLQHERHLRDFEGRPPQLDAMVFAFHCDRFGWPSELPFDGSTSVEVQTFPDQIEAPKDCEVPELRWFDGEQRAVCGKITDVDYRREPADFQTCSRKRIAHCPGGLTDLCETDTHKELHRGTAFRDWVFGKGVIDKFIAERIQNWNPPRGDRPQTPPCEFVRYPPAPPPS